MAKDEVAVERPGHHQGFSKEADAVMRLHDRGLITPLEARHALRKSGMELGPDEVEVPEIKLPTEEPTQEEAVDG